MNDNIIYAAGIIFAALGLKFIDEHRHRDAKLDIKVLVIPIAIVFLYDQSLELWNSGERLKHFVIAAACFVTLSPFIGWVWYNTKLRRLILAWTIISVGLFILIQKLLESLLVGFISAFAIMNISNLVKKCRHHLNRLRWKKDAKQKEIDDKHFEIKKLQNEAYKHHSTEQMLQRIIESLKD